MADQSLISAPDLGLSDADSGPALDLETVRSLAEREAIERALGQVGQNMTYAARLLGVSRMTLYRLKQKHGLVDFLAAV
jgi:DNA-binding NtrC family response regulator